MKILFRFFTKIYVLFFITLLMFTSTVIAKNIDLYDQPKADAKKVGVIDLSAGIMPIYSPKGSDWVKVADPRNGNVGWVKSSDLTNGSATSFSFTQKVSDGKDSQNYQVFQFGNAPALNTDQTQKALQQMQTQQLLNQQSVQQSIQKIVNDVNSIYQKQYNYLKESGFPIIMPIVIIPAQNNSTSAPVMTQPVNSKK